MTTHLERQAKAIDALLDGKVFAKVLIHSHTLTEVYMDTGEAWNVYQPTRQEVAQLLRRWRQTGIPLEVTHA